MERRVLVVDDDARIRSSLSRALSNGGTEVLTAESAERALAVFSESSADLVLTDLRMPGMDGLELLRLMRERQPDVTVVLMTAYDELPLVAEAMKEGAADFLVKPLDLHALRAVVARLFRDREAAPKARRRSDGGAEEPLRRPGAGEMVGRDPRMVEIFKLVGQVAATRANVLIRGESGTGKELIARQIHASAPWAEAPFVAVNCTALPATLLESELFGHVRGAFTGATSDRSGRIAAAGRGTLFLDEIGDTSADFQAKLLRVLQEHEYYPVGADRPARTDARIIAATHRDLEAMMAEGTFREDLYYRLRVVELSVPPLRERPDDIPLLAEHLLARVEAGAERGHPTLSDDARAALRTHSWPGNVRELENCLTRAAVLATGPVIRAEHLALRRPVDAKRDRLLRLEDVEAAHVAHVLRLMRGHKTRTAEALGISRPRLNRLIRKHDIPVPGSFDPPSSDDAS